MANELRVRVYVDYEKSGHTEIHKSWDWYHTISGGQVHHTEQDIGTSEEILLVGDFATGSAFCLLENHDSANPVHLRRATGESNFLSVPAGKAEPFFLSSNTVPYAIADGGTVRISLWMIEA